MFLLVLNRPLGARDQLTKSAWCEADRNAKRPLVWGMRHILDGVSKPSNAAFVRPFRDPPIGKCEEFIQNGSLMTVFERVESKHEITHVPGIDF